jgi:hypothetical protein
MADQEQAKFNGWAIVDVLGHQRYVGYVTTEAYGQAVLFRIDVPALDERERVTTRPEYGRNAHGSYSGATYLPPGSTVKEGAVPGYTKLIGAGSIYAITPCTKEAALAAVEEMQARPLMSASLPPERALSAGEPVDADVDDDDGESSHRDDELDDDGLPL